MKNIIDNKYVGLIATSSIVGTVFSAVACITNANWAVVGMTLSALIAIIFTIIYSIKTIVKLVEDDNPKINSEDEEDFVIILSH